MSAATENYVDRMRAENADLKFNALEQHRLKMALSSALGHDAKNPSMCDLVVVARLVIQERDAALEREQALAAHVERLRDAINEATDKHIAFAKRMALNSNHTSMLAVDKADDLLVRASFHVPVDTRCLTKRDLIKQAEALEWMANEFDEQGEYRGYALQIEERAYKLRQQAAAL